MIKNLVRHAARRNHGAGGLIRRPRPICDEADRIGTVDRMGSLGDIACGAVPSMIHSVFDHVNGWRNPLARNIRFIEDCDPSLPPVLANQDQLIQVFPNLLKKCRGSGRRSRRSDVLGFSSPRRSGVRLSAVPARNHVCRCRWNSASRTTAWRAEDLLPNLSSIPS
jgi:two-component system nitrogen regulation sensor histidine kinase GlnL